MRPRHGVAAAVGRELEPEFLAGDGTHRGDDAVPVLLPVLRVGAAAVGVGDAVHLPAEDQDGVRDLQGDEPLGEGAEVVVELVSRAAPQQLADLTVGHARLVALLKRDVEDEHPLVVGVAPARPVLEEADVALDVLPVVTGQVGVAHAQFRAAEPAAELLHPLHAARVGGQEGAERRHALRGCGGGHGRRPRLRQVGQLGHGHGGHVDVGGGEGRRGGLGAGRGPGSGAGRGLGGRCGAPGGARQRGPGPVHGRRPGRGARRQGGRHGDRRRAHGQGAGPDPPVLWGHWLLLFSLASACCLMPCC